MYRFNSGTADAALIATGSRPVYGFWLSPDGTNAASVIFYDNTSASGTILMTLFAPATQTVSVMLPGPIAAEIGIYADVTTGGACRAGAIFG